MVNYREYINSKEWKEIRLELLIHKECRCERCNRKYRPRFLHVHHLTYERLGNEEPEDLEVLCAGCHATEHGIKTKYNKPKKKKKKKAVGKVIVKKKRKRKKKKDKWLNKEFLMRRNHGHR